MNSEENRYQLWQQTRQEKWESLCGRCGACCGAVEGDPCEHLIRLDNSRYWCKIYSNRFGAHKTRSGKPFLCVPVRDIVHKPWPGDSCCGYKKAIREPELPRTNGHRSMPNPE